MVLQHFGISNNYDCRHLYLKRFFKADKCALMLAAMGTCSASANTNAAHGLLQGRWDICRGISPIHQHPPLFPVLLCCFKNTGKILKRFTVGETFEGPLPKVSSAA